MKITAAASLVLFAQRAAELGASQAVDPTTEDVATVDTIKPVLVW